jgi:hypothetical protein
LPTTLASAAVFIGFTSGDTLTVTSLLAGGIDAGQVILGPGAPPGLQILRPLTGRGGAGTYKLSSEFNLSSTTLRTILPPTIFLSDLIVGLPPASEPYTELDRMLIAQIVDGELPRLRSIDPGTIISLFSMNRHASNAHDDALQNLINATEGEYVSNFRGTNTALAGNTFFANGTQWFSDGTIALRPGSDDGSGLAVRFVDDDDTGIYSPTGNQVTIQVGGADGLRVTPTGTVVGNLFSDRVSIQTVGTPSAPLQIFTNVNEGDQLDPSIYIDRLIQDETDHSAHGVTDQTWFERPGGAYAAFDDKTTQVGNTAHHVSFQARPRFKDGRISEYVHGFDTNFIDEDGTSHVDFLIHFSAGATTDYLGQVDFEAAFIASALGGTEAWAFYTTQNRSRMRGITSFFGDPTVDPTTGLPDMAWQWFGDEDTGFYRSAANVFSIVAGAARTLDVTSTGTIQRGTIQGIDSGSTEFLFFTPTADSYLRDDRLAGVTRFNVVNAASSGATGAVASIGARSATAATSELAMLVTGSEFVGSGDWLLRSAGALRTNTGLTGGLSVAVLAGDYRLYTSGSLWAQTVSPAYALIAVTGATWASTGGGRITFTTATPHHFIPGMVFSTSGFTPSGYNGTWVTIAGTENSTIVVESGNPGAVSVLGQADARVRQVNFNTVINVGDLPKLGADATIYLRRALTESSDVGTGHGITIADDFSRDTFSYAAFDDQSTHSGVKNFGHHRGFQARSVMSFTGTMDFWDGHSSELNGTNAATIIGNVKHYMVVDDTQYLGQISGQQYGLYVDTLTKGDGGTYGIWVQSNTCRFPAGTTIDASGRIQLVAGASGAGNLSFWFGASDTDTGMYRSLADTIAVQTGGTNRAFFSSLGVVMVPSALVASLPANGQVTVEFTSDTSVKFVARGSDGTTRKSAPITLS